MPETMSDQTFWRKFCLGLAGLLAFAAVAGYIGYSVQSDDSISSNESTPTTGDPEVEIWSFEDERGYHGYMAVNPLGSGWPHNATQDDVPYTVPDPNCALYPAAGA